jgi:hypothetical protein
MSVSAHTINLLGSNAPDTSVFGRMITWVSTFGRYIMVVTELVVLVAFVSRFSLDRKLTDLNEEISQKQEILEVNADLETSIRTLQATLKSAKEIIVNEPLPLDVITMLQRTTPTGTALDGFTIRGNRLTTKAFSLSASSFNQFLAQLTADSLVQSVNVDSIERKANGGISYSLAILFAAPKGTK